MEQEASMEVIMEKLKTLDNLQESLERLTGMLENLCALNKSSQEQVRGLATKVHFLENHLRADNLVFQGIPEDDLETWQECETAVLDIIAQLGIHLESEDIVRAHRLGVVGHTRPRGVLVKFSSWKVKEAVFLNKSKLRGSKVFIEEDMNSREMGAKKALLQEAAKMKANGETAFVRANRLYCDQGTLQWNFQTNSLIKVLGDEPPASNS